MQSVDFKMLCQVIYRFVNKSGQGCVVGLKYHVFYSRNQTTYCLLLKKK